MEDVASRTVFAAGHLLFVRKGGIYARRFDPTRRVFSGPEFLVVDEAPTVDFSSTLY